MQRVRSSNRRVERRFPTIQPIPRNRRHFAGNELRDEWERCRNDCHLSGSNCTTTSTQTYQVFVRRPSDGLFCDDTQIIDGIPQQNVYEARGVNHNEETNTTSGTTANGNDEMEDIFNLIWDRDPSDFFQTNTRAAGC